MKLIATPNELTARINQAHLDSYARDTLDTAQNGLYEKLWQMHSSGTTVHAEQFEDILKRLERRIRRAYAQGLEEMELHKAPMRIDTTARNYRLPAIKETK